MDNEANNINCKYEAFDFCKACGHKEVCVYKEKFKWFNNLLNVFYINNRPQEFQVTYDLHCEHFTQAY